MTVSNRRRFVAAVGGVKSECVRATANQPTMMTSQSTASRSRSSTAPAQPLRRGSPRRLPKPTQSQREWAERKALRARAEAAEAEVERLRADLAQARADALVLAGLMHFDAAPGLAEVSVDALTNAIGAAASLPATEVLAVIRRALGGT